jgi:hypothetical protein
VMSHDATPGEALTIYVQRSGTNMAEDSQRCGVLLDPGHRP